MLQFVTKVSFKESGGAIKEMTAILLNDERYLNEVLEIEQSCFSIPWTRGMFIDEFTKSIACYIGMEKEGRLIGYGGFWKIFDEGHITNIAVSPEYRRQGTGKIIMEKLTEKCAEQGISKMTLEVRVSNKAAISLYKKMGFIAEGLRKGYYEDNKEDALIMWKTI